MKIDVTQTLLDPEGESLKDLRYMLRTALLQGEATDTGEIKYAKVALAMRIQNNIEVDFSIDDLAMTKKACIALTPWPYTLVIDILDPKGKDIPKE